MRCRGVRAAGATLVRDPGPSAGTLQPIREFQSVILDVYLMSIHHYQNYLGMIFYYCWQS